MEQNAPLAELFGRVESHLSWLAGNQDPIDPASSVFAGVIPPQERVLKDRFALGCGQHPGAKPNQLPGGNLGGDSNSIRDGVHRLHDRRSVAQQFHH